MALRISGAIAPDSVGTGEIADGSIATADLANDAVTYPKIQNVSATDKILGRSTSGAGDVEEIACTAAGRALLDDADAAAQRTTLGLVIGTNVQAQDAELAAIAGLTSAADKAIHFTGSGSAALHDQTALARTLLDDATLAAMYETLLLDNSAVRGRFEHYCDFISTSTQPFVAAAITGGTVSTPAGTIDANHPGVITLNSVGANTGFSYVMNAANIVLGGGEVFDVIFKTPADLTTVQVRMGFVDVVTTTEATDGVYFVIVGTQLTGKTSAASSRNETAAIHTLDVSTWYHGRITMNADATLATFELFTMAGAAVGTVRTLSTTIPTAETSCGVSAINTGAVSNPIISLDEMGFCIPGRTLVRGVPH